MRPLLVCLLAYVPLAGQPPVPRYEVKWTAGPIAIDGKLDEKEWESASPIELVFPWDFQTGEKQKTIVKLLWDDQYLYVAYDCEDHDIVAVYMERDDPTFKDDAIEIFLNPKPSQTDIYFGMEMNARAVLFDYVNFSSHYIFKRFNMQGVKLVSFIRGTLNARGDKDSGWSLEVAIPWVNFEEMAKPPVNGTIWTANLNRWDGVEPNRRLSIWSDPLQKTANPHVPARFGQLVFVR
jgi:Carbohydrate family 9 binding domain-like